MIVCSPSIMGWPVETSCLPLVPARITDPTPGPEPAPVTAFLPGPDQTTIGPVNPAADPTSAGRVRQGLAAAVAMLDSALGHMYQMRCVTVRPCGRTQGRGSGYVPADAWASGVLTDGSWTAHAPCEAPGRCDPAGRGAVILPSTWGPVRDIVGVEVDGVELDPSSYVLQGQTLYRASAGAWPGQDMGLPLGSYGTWAVTILAGTPPPPGAAGHVATLAGEIYAQCIGDPACRLPRDWVSVSRDGVSIKRIDPQVMLAQRATGLPEIDAWIAALNPVGMVRPVRVRGPLDIVR